MTVVLLSVLLCSCSANAQQHSPSMASLPVGIRKALLQLCAPCEFADYDAPWNPTDVLDGRPRRHLKRIEHTGDSWLIEYDHGGIGLHTHIVIFGLRPSIYIASGSSCDPLTTPSCEW